MPLTFKTGIAAGPGGKGRHGEDLDRLIFAADFTSETYRQGRNSVDLGALFNFTRTGSVRWHNPVSGKLETAGPNVPVFYDPRGRRGLYLAGGGWAMLAPNPNLSGTQLFQAAHYGQVGILMAYGPAGAAVEATGDIEPAYPGASMTATPGRPAYVRFLANRDNRFITMATAEAVGWRLVYNRYEDFGGTTMGNAAGDAAALTLVDPMVQALTARGGYVIRLSLRLPGHYDHIQTNTGILTVNDAAGNWFGLDLVDGAWQLRARQIVEAEGGPVRSWHLPLNRYDNAARRSPNLEAALRIRDGGRYADIRVSAGQASSNFRLPVMGPIAKFWIGKTGTGNPPVILDYLTAEWASPGPLSALPQRWL